MQQVLRKVLQENAAGAMDDALRHARSAGREQDAEWVVEGQADEGRFAGGTTIHLIGPGRHAATSAIGGGKVARHLGRIAETIDDDDSAQARQCTHDRQDLVGDGDHLAGVVVAVADDEHGGRDLPETIEHAGDAEIG